MKKAERIGGFVESMGLEDGSGLHPCYLAYFQCFNEGEYYEAHDVLEHLWLKSADESSAFYKGLIQLAGAFVHLKKQKARPHHPTDGRRLHPAFRLFLLAHRNLETYPDLHMGLDLVFLRQMISSYLSALQTFDFSKNPWSQESRPLLTLKSL